MNNSTLDKLKKLPPEKQKEVEDFVDFLLKKYTKEENKQVESRVDYTTLASEDSLSEDWLTEEDDRYQKLYKK